jgi:hypothetical protein
MSPWQRAGVKIKKKVVASRVELIDTFFAAVFPL